MACDPAGLVPPYAEPVRRSGVLAVIGAVVGVAVLAIGALVAFRLLPGARDTPQSNALSYPDGVLTPQEVNLGARPRPDGSLTIRQTLVFDAGPGTDQPARWGIGGTRLGYAAPDRRVQYWVDPRIEAVSAVEQPPTGPAVPLEVSLDDSSNSEPFRAVHRYRLIPRQPWSPGRHRVLLEATLRGVYVRAGDVAMVVVPLAMATGPGTSGQSLNVTRVGVPGGGPLRCLNAADTVDSAPNCERDLSSWGFLDADRDYDVEAVAIVEPRLITADPEPALEREQ